VGRYVDALAGGSAPPREVERLDASTREVERLMLGLRLDEPVKLIADARARGISATVSDVVDQRAVERLTDKGLVEQVDGGIRLTHRGRLLGDAVTAELIA
jgi:oxygen-independent coproporphyrinogen-3 oxidase